MNYQRKTFLLIAASTVLRLIFASSLELSNPEVYYWVYSLKLQWNYFDHPPMVAWLIRLTTANLLLHNEVFVRLGAIVSSALCTWLIFKIGTLLYDLRAGWFAALLYTSSIYGSIAAGTFILPDSPQMVFWFSAILILLKISRVTVEDRKYNFLWCLFGIATGLCIMSKVHGIFIWLGVALYAMVVHRDWLKYRGIYWSIAITLVIISPIIIWNLQNHFIGYEFQTNHIRFSENAVNLKRFIKQLASVILITNPVNFYLICKSFVYVIKRKLPADKKDIQLLLFCSLPLIFILLFISLFRETLAHWSGPAYSCLLILPAILLSASLENKRRLIPAGLKVGMAIMILMTVTEILITNYYPG
ncbi:MAG: glycosyltransferase family 39 protein, partial [Bacteroidota bacterium]|nr:glycosyltransferase family 39 protein [Bacteroidota bacterium]